MPLVNGQRFHTSTAVLLNEVMKLAVCLTLSLYDISRNLPPSTPASILFTALFDAVFTADCWKLAIPASLYTLQNTLQYVAVSNLSAATFQVTYQLKILTTAVFSVTLLRRHLSTRKWASLLLLTLGVAIVQLPSQSPLEYSSHKESQSRIYVPRSLDDVRGLGKAAARLVRRSATYEGIQEDLKLAQPQMNGKVGLVAVVIACILSGAAGVYFEKVLKDSKTVLWVRNVQLSFFSLFPAFFIGVCMKDGAEIARTGFFNGYNWVVWTAIMFQALGGVIVALCVNYADNIAKNFATSISILISALASTWFFDFRITSNFLFGTALVIFATYLYSKKEAPRPAPINIAEYEKTTIERNTRYDDHLTPPNPLRSDKALSTSRPNSPMRHHSRVASGRSKFAKRQE
ncbi:MAG: hypothetical protein M1815_001381 [Lichina confinis]|nr:MAG: hypothetical protein M1815_001381 [Lichina confinis]